ncbi:hypothetical protein HUG15_20850 [Salicibibacter cibarius]|uniref:Helix-turn-helix domain-containing protein n=1 Tax=Salicibibacter cibarius TaxID=2743000 RepID=A0A7T6Z6I2_9BACI|nr:hypothetical protein [Salicibibacter cibarius]QQK77784.1 hypothetical protein HUG15_20850 [Salicibibacter cibarius]
MTIAETVDLLHNYEIECDHITVRRWIMQGKLKAIHEDRIFKVKEPDVLDFLVDLSRVGTAYEKGINDETKIVRLEEKVLELQKEIDKLRCEKVNLEFKLGIMPF